MSSGSSSPKICVVIPVYEDYPVLKECLHALERQSLNYKDFEVLVVDNGTPADDFEDPRSYGHQMNLRLVREPKAGSYAARNAGIRGSESEFLAFTDADCRPGKRWLEEGLDALRDPRTGLVAGRVVVTQESEGTPNVVELQRLRSAFPQKRYVEEKGFGATANVFAKRSVFEEVGLFRAELRSSGDKEWGRRVQAAGYDLSYSHDAVVTHRARATLRELIEKSIRTAIGSYQVSRIEQSELRTQSKATSMWKIVGDIASDTVNGMRRLFRDPDLSFRQKVGVAVVSGIQQVTFRVTQRLMAARELFGRGKAVGVDGPTRT